MARPGRLLEKKDRTPDEDQRMLGITLTLRLLTGARLERMSVTSVTVAVGARLCSLGEGARALKHASFVMSF